MTRKQLINGKDYDGWAWRFLKVYKHLYGRQYYMLALQTKEPPGWWKIGGKLTGKWVRVKLVEVE